MATTVTIDFEAIESALRTNPPFTDPYAFEKARPFVADVVRIVGEYHLDAPVTVGRYFWVLAETFSLITYIGGRKYFGHNGLTAREFFKTMDAYIVALRQISGDVPAYLAQMGLTEAEALQADGRSLSPELQAEFAAGKLTFRHLLLTEPGVLLPRPFH